MNPASASAAAPTTALPGVGPARAARLASIGIASVRDLLLCIPRRLEAWPAPTPLRALAGAQPGAHVGESHVVEGRVASFRFSRFGRRSLLRLTLQDPEDVGTVLEVLFFNQSWLRRRFSAGETLQLRGKVVDVRGFALVCERLGSAERPLPAAGELEATYPAGDGLTQEGLRRLCRLALERHGDDLQEPLPDDVLCAHDLPPLPRAVRELHAPTSPAAFERAARRASLERLFAVQARVVARRAERAAARARRVRVDPGLRERLRAALPFALTAGQERVADELVRDLESGVPMRRLLQGDVGSGKTVLGLWAAAAVAAHGGQSAFLAPTELLAEQHADGLRGWCARLGLSTALLTGSLGAAERRAVLARIASGEARVVFGTHSLFSDDVRYAQLDLAVIDEQHRFGVAQRRRLLEKGRDVHALLMTATPIPRSLALVHYGDLDVSVLRERPPGRGTVRTQWVRGPDRLKVPTALERRLAAGERAFWVVPRIGADDEAEDAVAAAQAAQVGAVERHERLSKRPLARFGIELVHGRQPGAERARRLERFRTGAVRVLVATTVIEVGVDVPEATVMVIENAERLGLAQLHQLRGRIGRGGGDGHCVLLGARSGEERFRCLERTDDGFEIAELDLERRGMGDLAGLRQAGANAEGLAGPDRDGALVELARDTMAENPELARAYLGNPESGAGVAASPDTR